VIIRKLTMPMCQHYPPDGPTCHCYGVYELQFDIMTAPLNLCEAHLKERVGKFITRPCWHEIRIQTNT
jgi:hypothetical protein